MVKACWGIVIVPEIRKRFAPIPEKAERASKAVVEAAFKVHHALGPGLLESVYEVCLCHEMSKSGISFRRQATLPVSYDGVKLDSGLRVDLLVEDCLIAELKAVEKMNPLFDAQLLTYLKLSGVRLGLLINFNVQLIKDGIKRIVL